ncbi:hypothetical protein MKZ38_004574 [Zalerion maritima]|uniref:Uncharacterized protein n=1 Tax=Zalerion maritima TaxID=339359 RepID=A0AAD5RYE4_9PEZI|nr:hypothetical protein MKZ38_004574 [Zalerion maritima]
MGGGNGAKAAQKRERNKKKADGAPKSQLKSNAAAQTLKCKICMTTFQSTTKQPQLAQHAENKHSKAIDDCFPEFQVQV